MQSGLSHYGVQAALLGLFVLVTNLCIFFLLSPSLGGLAAGQVSPRDVEAPRMLVVNDEAATDAARRQAIASVAPVYRIKPEIERDAIEKLDATFELVRQMHEATDADALLARCPLKVSPDTLHDLAAATPEERDELLLICRDTLHHVLEKGIKTEDMGDAEKAVQESISRVPMQARYMVAAVNVTSAALQPNEGENWEEIQREQQERASAVEPVRRVIQKGEMIVRKGDVVSRQQADILTAYNASEPHWSLQGLIGVSLFSLFGLFVIGAFLWLHDPATLREPRLLWLCALIMTLTAVICRWLMLHTNGYMAPLALASMLVALLIDYRLALIATALLSIMVGLFSGEVEHGVVALLTGIVGVVSVARVSRRKDLMLASLVVCLANIIAILTIGLVKHEISSDHVWAELAAGLINGMVASLACMGMLPFLESIFDITTHIKLLELSNPGEPLLQKLMVDAPGTYHHSIIVANLADAAARAIGADALLARVGAYYHDIGKMKRSTFFVENQLGCGNPHDKLTPTLSTMIITSHVKDGLELAKKYRLPRPIMDFIDMHHGTRLVQYFYHQAREKAGGEVPEETFRHHGRKPHSRETAIVMVADTVEAKARLMTRPDRESLEKMINETLRTIISDGQLDACDLSLKDIKLVAASFVNTLLGIYHNRVEYPKDVQLALPREPSDPAAAAMETPRTEPPATTVPPSN
ncbi:MAG: HD family phosphohydrolase [Candidatus Xenobia bacterium]